MWQLSLIPLTSNMVVCSSCRGIADFVSPFVASRLVVCGTALCLCHNTAIAVTSCRASTFSINEHASIQLSAMSKKDTGKVPPAAEPISPTGSWADGAEGIKAATGTQSGSKAAAAAAAAIVSGGMAGRKAADTPESSPKAAGNQRTSPTRRAPSPSPSKAAGAEERSTESKLLDALSALAAKVDQQHEHAELLNAKVESLAAEFERGGGISSRRSSNLSDSGSESDTSNSSADSLASSVDNVEYQPFVRVPIDIGFCGSKAAERAADVDQTPRRFSLHGYEPYDKLCAGKRGDGGTLGLIMQYLEPARLYYKTGLRGFKAALRSIDESDPLYDDLRACYNTLDGAFNLVNTLATITVERAKVVSPGSTSSDKRRLEWIESQLAEDDYATADVAPRIRKLKARYDYEAGKADLRYAAGKGGASGSSLGGRDHERREHRERRDDPRGGRSKSQKRRERRERHRDESPPPRSEKPEREQRERREERPRGSAGRSDDRRERRAEGRRSESSSSKRDEASRGGRRDNNGSSSSRGGRSERGRDERDGRGRPGDGREGGKGNRGKGKARAASGSSDGGYSSGGSY